MAAKSKGFVWGRGAGRGRLLLKENSGSQRGNGKFWKLNKGENGPDCSGWGLLSLWGGSRCARDSAPHRRFASPGGGRDAGLGRRPRRCPALAQGTRPERPDVGRGGPGSCLRGWAAARGERGTGRTRRADTPAGASSRALGLPQPPRPPPRPSPRPLLPVPPPPPAPRGPALPCPQPDSRNPFPSLRAAGVGGWGREARAPAAPAPWAARRAGRDRRREEGCSRAGRGRGRGHLRALRRWSPCLPPLPAPRAPTPGEVVAKFPRAAWARASEAQGGVRTPGGEDRRSSRRLCSAPGERPGKQSPGAHGDRRPRHSGRSRGSWLLTVLLQAAPHPQANGDQCFQVPRPPFLPQTSPPRKDPKCLGWGKREGGGEGARWAGHLPKGGCWLWNVWVLFLRPRSCFPTRPPIPCIPPTSPFASSSILVRSRRKISAGRSPSESQCGGPEQG